MKFDLYDIVMKKTKTEKHFYKVLNSWLNIVYFPPIRRDMEKPKTDWHLEILSGA